MSNFIQRFLWSCAGVDIEVLEQCSSDHKKYTSIGAIIFIVACLASLAMYFAASTIISNPFAAIVVALIWGIMILMLDRLIVSTIRNDEDTTTRDKWIAAIPRIVLAMIIAVVISRPIEVQIFSQEIKKQVTKDRILEQNYVKDQLVKGSSLGHLAETDTSLVQQEKSNQALLLVEDIPTSEYQRLKNELRFAEAEFREAEKGKNTSDYNFSKRELKKIEEASTNNDTYFESYDKKNWVDEAKTTYTISKERRFRSEWQRKQENWQEIVNGVINTINKAKRKMRSIEKQMIQEQKKYHESIALTISEINSRRDSIQKEREKENQKIEMDAGEFEGESNDSIPSFFTQMRALSNLGHDIDESGNRAGLNLFWWAKWFILLLFFVVEISPVFVKIISPSGAYDEAYLKKQSTDLQIFRDNLNAKIDVAQFHRQEWINEQRKKGTQDNLDSSLNNEGGK